MQRIGGNRRRMLGASAVGTMAILFGFLLSAAPPSAGVARAAVEEAQCVVEVPSGSQCGELTVPIARGVPDTPAETLPYAVVPASLDTGRAPIVYLSGGVPMSEVDVQGLAIDRGLAADRDVVIVERRGGSTSTPALDCAPAVAAIDRALRSAGDRPAAIQSISEAYVSCAASWQEKGFTASDFGVAQSASDLRSLREQLGYARWTIMAVGTSASVALAAPEADPEGIDGIILDGPDLGVPGVVSAGGLAAALAAIDTRSGGSVPVDPKTESDADLTAIERVGATESLPVTQTEPLADLADQATAGGDPVVRAATVVAEASDVLARHPHTTSGSDAVTVGPDVLLAVASGALADATAQAALPFALQSIADGRSDAIDALASPAVDTIVGADPVPDSVLACNTVGWPGAAERSGDAQPAAATTLLEEISGASCTALGIAPAAPPAAVDVRALVLSAAEQAAASAGSAAASLPRAAVATFSGVGAVPSATSACAVIAVRAWLAEPDAFRGTLCAGDDAAVAVVHASEVSASPRWVEQTAVGSHGSWLLLIVPFLFGIVSIAWTIGWVYRLVAQALRHDPVQASLLVGVAPVFGATWFIGSVVAFTRAAEANPAIQLLGVPSALPWLSIALLVSCIGLVPVWQGAHRGARLRILAISVLWAATAVWTAVFVLAWW